MDDGWNLQEEAPEQPFMWRSSSFPTPGFEPYDNPAIQPVPEQDPDDRWNLRFSLLGSPKRLLTITVPGASGTV